MHTLAAFAFSEVTYLVVFVAKLGQIVAYLYESFN